MYGWEQHIASNMFWNPKFHSFKAGTWQIGDSWPRDWKGIHSTWSKNQHPNPNHSKSYPVDSNVWETLIKKTANGHPKGLKHVSIVIFCSLRRVDTWASYEVEAVASRGWCYDAVEFSTFSTSFCYRACCLERELHARVWRVCWERAGFCFGFYLLSWFIGFHPFHFDRYANLQIYHGKIHDHLTSHLHLWNSLCCFARQRIIKPMAGVIDVVFL